jgi:hypothetical protein
MVVLPAPERPVIQTTKPGLLFECDVMVVGLSGYQVVGLSGYQVVRLSGCQVVRLSGCQVVKLSGCQVVKLSGCQVVRLSGCQVVRLSGYQVIRLSSCQGEGEGFVGSRVALRSRYLMKPLIMRLHLIACSQAERNSCSLI